ncbi:hypothetical protein [Winogradskya consettensis]|uniref:hypothetical protein n=1 Tax=Winogradskya consettensis TaxID=113560 RepID=UPI001BB40CFA|nr:hypothetical protein [Actinoplanes consettensis]
MHALLGEGSGGGVVEVADVVARGAVHGRVAVAVVANVGRTPLARVAAIRVAGAFAVHGRGERTTDECAP